MGCCQKLDYWYVILKRHYPVHLRLHNTSMRNFIIGETVSRMGKPYKEGESLEKCPFYTICMLGPAWLELKSQVYS